MVKLEDYENGTKLIYEVQANVGGKIAQVGSRLIDMTAKKMADIFFKKFSEVISKETITSKDQIDTEEEISENQISKKQKSNNKTLYYSASVLVVAIIIYLIF